MMPPVVSVDNIPYAFAIRKGAPTPFSSSQGDGMALREPDVYALVLGRVIATLRERRGWTQAQLAQTVNIAQSSVSRIEKGQTTPEIYLFQQLAYAFGMTPGDLDVMVRRAHARTQAAAQAAAPSGGTEPWWVVAAGVAGIAGFVGLVVFAVAAALAEEERAARRRR